MSLINCRMCGGRVSIGNISAVHCDFCNSTMNYLQTVIEFANKQWLLLDIKDDKALLLSKNIIAQKPYHSSKAHIVWANCTLRKYLNNDYLNKFTPVDQEQIAETTISNEPNQWYGSDGGPDTDDKIFCLSLLEVMKYFEDKANPKKYAFDPAHNASRIAKHNDVPLWWWLRSPGDYNLLASLVLSDGHIHVLGNFVYDTHGGVRPAMWVNMS